MRRISGHALQARFVAHDRRVGARLLRVRRAWSDHRLCRRPEAVAPAAQAGTSGIRATTHQPHGWGPVMDARFILDAIRQAHPTTAVVPELTIEDFDLPDSGEVVEYSYIAGQAPPEGHKYSRRIDALMFDSLLRTAIEIKVTRPDFMRDTYWKRRAWQNVTHRFVYAVPHDLDVMPPHGCGLWKVDESGRITVVKKAIVSKTPDPLPQTVVQRMAYRAAKAHGPAHQSNDPESPTNHTDRSTS